MTAYNPQDSSRQSGKRSVLRWLQHYRPVVVDVETDTGERERIVIDQKSTKRWDACYATMVSLNVCVARALDTKDAVLATYVIRERPDAEPEPNGAIVQHPATTGGTDVAAIMNTFADALVRGVERVADKIVEAQRTAFTELTNIAKASNERALISERERMRALDDRERRIEEEEERAEEERARADDERERIEREREQEREDNQGLREMMQPLLGAVAASAGPALVEALSKKAEPQKVKVEAKAVPDPAAPKSTNGAKT